LIRNDRKEVASDKVNTIVGKGTFFKGVIKTNGIVRVDGEVEGEIITQADVIVGESGKVKVDIKAANVAIAGSVEGNVDADGKMELRESGTLIGDVKAQHLAIDDGALFKGNCEMKNNGEGSTGKKRKGGLSRLGGNGRQGKLENGSMNDDAANIRIDDSIINEDLIK